MCKDCVKEEFPDRGTVCIESGSYMVNYAACVQCKKQQPINTTNKRLEETEEEETITYNHVCESCNHIIATHEYKFEVDGDYQLYEMYCLLCGRAEDSRSVYPVDPRHNVFF